MDKISKVTVLHAVRYDGLRIDQDVFARVLHDEDLDLMSAIDSCFTAWYKTPAGRTAWEQSCSDYNIGDMLCGPAPSAAFTRGHGFEFLPDDGEDIIEISYDRVLGDGSNGDEEEQTLDVEQVCECCGRHFWLLYHEDGVYDLLDDRGDSPCDCKAGFHPIDGSPTITEWLASLSS